MLPLVRRIARDIRDDYRDLQPLLRRSRQMADDEVPDELRRELERRTSRLNGYLDELLALGCQFKGFDEGLVDFHSLYEGRPVLLCWKLGEAEVAWWHEIDGGFAGRQPIARDERDRFRSS